MGPPLATDDAPAVSFSASRGASPPRPATAMPQADRVDVASDHATPAAATQPVVEQQAERVLVACEESQAVVKAFRALGHVAFSCDTQPCSGGKPQWHLQKDCFEALERDGPWDLLIAFPPCTHLAASGAQYWPAKRADGRQQAAVEFVKRLYWAEGVARVAIENPLGVLSTEWMTPTQTIQPYEFGDPFTSAPTSGYATCLRSSTPTSWSPLTGGAATRRALGPAATAAARRRGCPMRLTLRARPRSAPRRFPASRRPWRRSGAVRAAAWARRRASTSCLWWEVPPNEAAQPGSGCPTLVSWP